jgi:1,4-dihydroxy-2-naphthoate octaprenyltransferase
MSGVWLDALRTLGCLLLVGAAVKLMDDYLDADYDASRGQQTLAVKLGRATLPYALALGFIGAVLDARLALSLFLGSYAVGMFATWRERLPTRVPAVIEILVAAGLAAALAGWQTALWAMAMMAVVDWVDDLVDMYGDAASNQFNLAIRIGPTETVFLVLLALLVAVTVNAAYTMWAFVALGVLTALSELTTNRRGPMLPED